MLENGINDLLVMLGITEKISLDDNTLNSIREKCKNQNLGMSMKQNCGMMATCIAYRDHNDIDVQFEDGTIAKSKSKTAFLKGLIKNPELYKAIQKQNSLNMTVRMNNGMNATCIAYRKSTDIDVQFEDGTIVEHVQKQHFVRGNVKHPNLENPKIALSSCVGTTLRMKNGMLATCIAYRNGLDIDVQFEDGTVVTNKRKGNFLRGEIDNPNYNRHSCLKRTVMQNCGMLATCIAYRDCYDIDVQFEDGTIAKNKQKQAFMNGQVGHPNHNTNNLKSSCLNITKRMNNGMMATCVVYRNSNDIDVQFEDGLLAKHRRKDRFLKGQVAHKVFNDRD